MHHTIILFIILQYCLSALAWGDDEYLEVEIADPFIELHTGPGRGYPVFHVVDRGERVEIIKRRTDWFKVRTAKGKEGWVTRGQMELTLMPSGDRLQFAETGPGDFSRRHWEAGLTGGDFDGANVISVYGARAFTPNLSAELGVSQVFGDYSDSYLATISLVAQPFPEWRLSPFFSVGTGVIYTDPKTTLVEEDDQTDQVGSVGGGVRWYLTRRFILRAEYRNYVIFQDKDDNQEINEWKAGFAFFF